MYKGQSNRIIILGLILLFLAMGIYTVYLYRGGQLQIWRAPTTSNKPSLGKDTEIPPAESIEYARGQVLVTFNVGVTESQASELLKSKRLEPVNPDGFFRYQTATFFSTEDDVTGIAKEMNQIEFVSSVFPVNKGEKAAQQSMININFSRPVTQNEIKQLLNVSDSLTFPDTEKTFGRHELVKVPIGSEKYWAGELSKEEIVKSASLNTISKPFN